jgi:hypothetical protein
MTHAHQCMCAFVVMQDMADPMFAYCRQHVDKELRRSRRRNWMALQPFVRARQEESKLAGSDIQVCAHTRIISLGFRSSYCCVRDVTVQP